VSLLISCSSESTTTEDGRPPRDTQSSTLGDGLPCAVASTLESRCWGCHGNPPTSNAPFSLATIDDLKTPGLGGVSRAERAVIRMRDTARPMPPQGPPTEPEIVVIEQWIAAGMTEETCNPDNCTTCDQLLTDIVACMPPMALPQFCDTTDGPTFYQCAIQNCGTECAIAIPGQTPPPCDVANGPSCRSCVEASCAMEITSCAQ
jgi:hypothetical protein